MSANLSNSIRFLPVPPSASATRVELKFDCEASTQVNDIVYQDSLNANKVLSNINNTRVNASIGVVVRKPTTTTCVVLVLGINDGYTGLSIGSKIFLATDGTTTTTKPTSGYLQTLGTAVSTTQVFFLPNNQRVLQV